MKSKRLTISVLSIFLLAAGSCSGDFCAVYTQVPPLDEETAAQLVSAGRASAAAIATNETYFARNCEGLLQ